VFGANWGYLLAKTCVQIAGLVLAVASCTCEGGCGVAVDRLSVMSYEWPLFPFSCM